MKNTDDELKRVSEAGKKGFIGGSLYRDTIFPFEHLPFEKDSDTESTDVKVMVIDHKPIIAETKAQEANLTGLLVATAALSSLDGFDYLSSIIDKSIKNGYKKSMLRGVHVGVRIEPKIGRNEVCPKCESGKKFKKCCGIHLYNQR